MGAVGMPAHSTFSAPSSTYLTASMHTLLPTPLHTPLLSAASGGSGSHTGDSGSGSLNSGGSGGGALNSQPFMLSGGSHQHPLHQQHQHQHQLLHQQQQQHQQQHQQLHQHQGAGLNSVGRSQYSIPSRSLSGGSMNSGSGIGSGSGAHGGMGSSLAQRMGLSNPTSPGTSGAHRDIPHALLLAAGDMSSTSALSSTPSGSVSSTPMHMGMGMGLGMHIAIPPPQSPSVFLSGGSGTNGGTHHGSGTFVPPVPLSPSLAALMAQSASASASPSQRPCLQCGQAGTSSSLYFCAACRRALHPACATSELMALPNSMWVCGTCTVEKNLASKLVPMRSIRSMLTTRSPSLSGLAGVAGHGHGAGAGSSGLLVNTPSPALPSPLGAPLSSLPPHFSPRLPALRLSSSSSSSSSLPSLPSSSSPSVSAAGMTVSAVSNVQSHGMRPNTFGASVAANLTATNTAAAVGTTNARSHAQNQHGHSVAAVSLVGIDSHSPSSSASSVSGRSGGISAGVAEGGLAHAGPNSLSNPVELSASMSPRPHLHADAMSSVLAAAAAVQSPSSALAMLRSAWRGSNAKSSPVSASAGSSAEANSSAVNSADGSDPWRAQASSPGAGRTVIAAIMRSSPPPSAAGANPQ
jgi:hypothetical protein